MKSQTSVHLKFEYDNAIDSRRKLLELEMMTVENIKQLKRYAKRRKEEFGLKGALKSKFSELAKLMNNLNDFFPKDIITKHSENLGIPKQVKFKVETERGRMTNLERELFELKARLQALQ